MPVQRLLGLVDFPVVSYHFLYPLVCLLLLPGAAVRLRAVAAGQSRVATHRHAAPTAAATILTA